MSKLGLIKTCSQAQTTLQHVYFLSCWIVWNV